MDVSRWPRLMKKQCPVFSIIFGTLLLLWIWKELSFCMQCILRRSYFSSSRLLGHYKEKDVIAGSSTCRWREESRRLLCLVSISLCSVKVTLAGKANIVTDILEKFVLSM